MLKLFFQQHHVDFCFRYAVFLKSEEEGKASGQTRIDAFSNVQKSSSSHPDQKRFIKSVALNLVVDCDLPLNIVTRPGFLKHSEVTNYKYAAVDK